MEKISLSFEEQYEALTGGAGFSEMAGRTQIELTGGDRLKFLHGLCTNDIRSLNPGSGCEAFLTNVQGKTVGYVYVFCRDDSLVLDTVPGQTETIMNGLDRYLIREDVQIHDRSDEWLEFLVGGKAAAGLLREHLDWAPSRASLGHVEVDVRQTPASLRTVPYGGDYSLFLSLPPQQREVGHLLLGEAGLTECSPDVVEVVRIESGTPLFGIDLTSDNLPQEVARDKQAIHFNKGCYLGQETVARLDALGHVNRLLVGIQFEGDAVPAPGSVLKQDGKPLARITSSCWSPALAAPLALAYVRRGHTAPGCSIRTEFGNGEVVPLPVAQRV